MSVRPVDAQRSFYHTDYLAGNLFGSVNRYRLFREKIWPKLLELGPKLDALYCDVIVTRWEQFTGKKARRETGSGRTGGRMSKEAASGSDQEKHR